MNIEITPFEQGQEEQISELIRKVYDEFVANDYTDEGNRFFYDWISAVKISERQRNQISLFVAHADSFLAGMIEIRENKNITLLFVDKKYHGNGIAKSLFQVALDDCRRKDPSLKKFFVHASPFSIPIYEKLGFKATDIMQVEYGIKYLPMEMDLT